MEQHLLITLRYCNKHTHFFNPIATPNNGALVFHHYTLTVLNGTLPTIEAYNA